MPYIEYVLNRIHMMKRESEKMAHKLPTVFDRPRLRIVKFEVDDALEQERQEYFDYWRP